MSTAKSAGHLILEAGGRAATQISRAERFQYVDDIFLFSPSINNVLVHLQRALENPRRHGKAGVIAIYGARGIGKHHIVRRFRAAHPPVSTDHVDCQPVILATPTAFLTPAGMAEAIIGDTNWNLRVGLRGGKLPEKAVDRILRDLENRVLIINRANFLSRDGKTIDRSNQPFLVNLIDRGATNVVFVGDYHLPNILGSLLEDDQYSHLEVTAFRRPEKIVEANGAKTSLWFNCIMKLAELLPFESTCLVQPGMAFRLYVATAGRLPALMDLVKSASLEAFYAKGEANELLSIANLSAAFARMKPHATNPFACELAHLEDVGDEQVVVPSLQCDPELDLIRIANRRPR